MIKYLPLFAVLMAGCYGPEVASLDDPRYVKKCSVPYYGTLYAEYEIDCEYATTVIELSRQLHGVTKTIPLDDYDSIVKGTPLRVMSTDTFEMMGSSYGGMYNPWNGMGIVVNQSMESLFHEEMHLWEGKHVDPTTPLHLDWEKPSKGYYGASGVFSRVVLNENWSDLRGEMSDEMIQALEQYGYGWYLNNPNE